MSEVRSDSRGREFVSCLGFGSILVVLGPRSVLFVLLPTRLPPTSSNSHSLSLSLSLPLIGSTTVRHYISPLILGCIPCSLGSIIITSSSSSSSSSLFFHLSCLSFLLVSLVSCFYSLVSIPTPSSLVPIAIPFSSSSSSPSPGPLLLFFSP